MSIVRTLAKSLRKYKKETIITPIFITVEVLMECTMPLLISRIINTLEKSKNLETGSGGLLQSIIIYGLILVAMAGISYFQASWRLNSAPVPVLVLPPL